MAGARTPTLDSSKDRSEQDKNVDASASDPLLISQGGFHDDASDSDTSSQRQEPPLYSSKDRDLGEPPSYHAKRHQSFFKANRKWLLLLAPLCLALLYFVVKLFSQHDAPAAHASHPSRPSHPFPSSSSSSPHSLSVSGFSGPRSTFTFTNGTQFVKPRKMKVVGIIFYGRRQFVNILECYLRRNLIVNGGMLDEVHFLLHTNITEDIRWIKRTVKRSHLQKYYKLKEEDTSGNWDQWKTYQDLYKNHMTDPNTIYVKIDDDMVFIDDYAIPEMLRTLLEHPEAHNIQANVINSKWNHWHHLRTGAAWPYLPEQSGGSKWPENAWRASELPRYKGQVPARGANIKVPNEGHRWLPLEPTFDNLVRTPYGGKLRNPDFKSSDTKPTWGLCAQTHYSFLQNHERGELGRFAFGSGHDYSWNRMFVRYNINVVMIRGSTIARDKLWSDKYRKAAHSGDEILLSVKIPKERNEPVLLATKAIVVHYSFKDVRPELLRTDLLDRYRALANEHYCTADNYKPRLGARLGPHHVPAREFPHHDLDEDFTDDDSVIGDGPQDFFNPDEDNDDDYDDHGDVINAS